MTERIGVGFVGAGGVVKTIHVPTLARMSNDFHVAAVWDVDAETAGSIAAQTGARRVETFDDLLADEEVDVLVVCSPARFHAEQIIRGMRAGKRAILCEKPLAAEAEDARLVKQAAEETGVPLLLGAMHMFDPAWAAAQSKLDSLVRDATTIRSSIALPFNDRFEAWTTELGDRMPPSFAGDDIAQILMRQCVMELAIHDLPLVRAFVPEGAPVRVTSATLLEPFGYGITVDAGDRVLDLFGYISGSWQPDWELEVTSPSATLHVQFPPSFVHAGSAVATITEPAGTTVLGPFERNGYEGEWELVRDLARGNDVAIPPVAQLVEDFRFALSIAEQSCALLARENQK
ncbi:Gfo/Idh/MocA family protein [Rhizorhabdus argentea]|uniref:Gfo/Idh/MocA family protein n=1 Tax=Rhizorhabdus argentea TaxID=1387174 RepID=UPI0030EBBBD4